LTSPTGALKIAGSECSRFSNVLGETVDISEQQTSESAGGEVFHPAVGARVRTLRRQSGLGLRELARQVGVSASSLSALENNRGGVSVRRLQQVAEYFGLHVSDMLASEVTVDQQQGKVEVIRVDAPETAGVERGTGVLYRLLGSRGTHVLQPFLVAFQPGGTYEQDMIQHPGEEFAYVLFGEVELLLGTDVFHLGAGDAVRFNPETPHAFRNPSTAGVSILVGCATPPW
jgi:transcriptional regulator with XRE-family HTH domain